MELSHRVESGDLIQVLYSSSCLSGRPPTQTNRCDGLEIGSDVEFNVTIKVNLFFLFSQLKSSQVSIFSNLLLVIF